MKRAIAVFLVMVLCCLPVSAQSSFTYVTDFDYAVIRDGGTDGAFVYGAYENDGQDYVIGLLTEDGEQSRTAWTAEGWSALFASSDWDMTVHGDAGSFCPYAGTHRSGTLCPYLDVSLVSLTNKKTDVTLENYYIQNTQKHVSTGNTIHVCLGNYQYKTPETLRWDGESPCVAVRDEGGFWGVFDTRTNAMRTAYAYDDMSAVYGYYAKVFNGTAWSRLDLTNATKKAYIYASPDEFSVTEEAREIADGQYRVFNADNEPISVVYKLDAETVVYEPQSHLVLSTAKDGTKTLYDLSGVTVAVFEPSQKVLHLENTGYAIENYSDRGTVLGVALATVKDVVKPDDTILMGDINFSGAVDSTDARALLRRVTGAEHLTARQKLAADSNADGVADSADIRALMISLIV